jgi:hypothetical protein
MSYFKLAVGVPIKNHTFSLPKFFSGKFYAAAAVSAKTIYIEAVSPTSAEIRADMIMKRGDVLTLTSTNATHSGQTEQIVIESFMLTATYYTVELQSPLTKAYLDEDLVYGYGSGWPEGFTYSGGASTILNMTTIKPFDGGYGDNYSFSGYSTSTSTLYLRTDTFDIDPWLESCYFRIGAWFKSLGTTSSYKLYLGAYDGNTSVSKYSYPFLQANKTWEEISSSEVGIGNSLSEYKNTVLN